MNFSALCQFSDKQWLATETADNHKYTLFGGSRGPGKSYWLRWYLLRSLLLFAASGIQGVNVMLACENYPALKDRQIGKIQKEFPDHLGTLKSSKATGLGFHLHRHYGGGVIALRNLDDPTKYQSAEFGIIAIDEITKNPERTFHILRGSLRWPGIDRGRMIAATNPDANWVRDYWIEKRFPSELEPEVGEFAFVPALPGDNPHLTSDYWTMLDTLPGALREAWLHGDWYAGVEGLVYSSFAMENVVKTEPDPSKPYEIAIDDGYIDPRATVFIQRQNDGSILVFDEIYHSKRLADETINQIVAMASDKYNGRLPELATVSHEAVELRTRLRRANIPARNWMSKRAGGKGVSTRLEAIGKTRALICDGKGKRNLFIHERCYNLLDEIRSGYKYPEGKRGTHEHPADGNDHACQALESWVWLRG